MHCTGDAGEPLAAMPSAPGTGMPSPDAAGSGLLQPMDVDTDTHPQPSPAAEEADAAGADVVAGDAQLAEPSEQPDEAAQPVLPNGVSEDAQPEPSSSGAADDEGGAAVDQATAADTHAANSAAAADDSQMNNGSGESGDSGDAGAAGHPGGSDSDDDVPLGRRPATAAGNGGDAATASGADAAAASDEDSDDRPLARFGSLNSGQSGPPSSPAAQPPKRQKTDGKWAGGDADSRASAAEARAAVRPGASTSGGKERPGSGKSKTYTLPKIKRCALLTTPG